MSKPLSLKDFEAKIKKSTDNKNGWIKYNNTYIHHTNGSYNNDPALGFALVSFKYDDTVDYTITYEDSLQHNLNGPSKLSYDSNGMVCKKDYYIEGRHYATEKTWADAVAKLKPAAKTDEEKWLAANKDMGFVKSIASTGAVNYTRTNNAGDIHCDTGPAVVLFSKDGSMQKIVHCKNGKVHNTNGPAVVKFSYGSQNGAVKELDITNEYWLDGKFETFQEQEFSRAVLDRKMRETFTPELLKKYFPVGVKDYSLKLLTGTWADGATSTLLDGHILYSKGSRYVYFNNLEKSAINSWTNWYGPIELELKPDGTIEKRYFMHGKSCSLADWKLLLIKDDQGIPAFIRNTEAKKYAEDIGNNVIPAYSAEEIKEKVVKFVDDPSQAFSSMVYTYNNNLFLLFKVDGSIVEKKIGLKPIITADGTLKIDSEYRTATLCTDAGNRDHIVDKSTYKLLSESEFDKLYNTFAEQRNVFHTANGFLEGMIKQTATTSRLVPSQIITSAATAASYKFIMGTQTVDHLVVSKQPTTIKDVVVSDSKEVLKRISVMKITSFVQELLVASSMKQGAQANKLREALKSVFESERGRVVLSFLIGTTMPVLTAKLPEKYHPILEEIATEFRVQAETVAIEKMVEAVAGGVWGTVQESLDRILNRPVETRIRVEVMSDAPLTAEGGDLESSEDAITSPVDNKLLN